MGDLILGVDIGTTSVKVGLLKSSTGEVVCRQSKDTQANVPSELGYEGNKQNVPKIMSALHSCVSRLPKELLKQTTKIGICGQMHGVMLWGYDVDDAGAPWIRPDSDVGRFDVRASAVSSLYTWQDSRCTEDFIATLPAPDSHLKATTGYGVNTLFWFARNRPEKLEKFNCAGTVQDFAVAMLCNLEKPIMSVQNAASWGYFDPTTGQWNTEILDKAGFPVGFLPCVVESGQVAGTLAETWHGIPAGTPVVAALGDLQCSVLSTLHHDDDAVLNISTSAQIAFIAPNPTPWLQHIDNNAVEFIPYFSGRYLAVAAALNGGNALATFISTLQQWTVELGVQLPQSTLWEKSIAAASKIKQTNLRVTPRLLGERDQPSLKASVTEATCGNLGLGHVFRGVCQGIVDNLHRMMPREMLLLNNISRILGTGSALVRNPVLQEEVQKGYQLPIVFEGRGDAARGAALAAKLFP